MKKIKNYFYNTESKTKKKKKKIKFNCLNNIFYLKYYFFKNFY